MNSVVELFPNKKHENPPLLVLLDMQREHENNKRYQIVPALANCRKLLRHARACNLQIAFTRWVGQGAFFSSAPQIDWIDGFTPNRRDLVFERDRPSCYANTCFEDAITLRNSNFILAGFSGNVACLATILDAFHRHHLVTYLSDASASEQIDSDAASDVHRFVVSLIKLYGKVVNTDDWIAGTSGLISREKSNGWI